MATRDQLIDELLKEYQASDDLFSQDGLLKQLIKDLAERILQAEMAAHLGYERHASTGRGSGNSRNGTRRKTLKGDQGELPLDIPRDRNGEYEPQLIPNGQSRIPGFDDKIISLYARGMTTREIQAHLEEIYSVDVSPTLISNITAVVLDEVKAWQSRPLDAIYPILYLDALQVKIRDEGTVSNKAIYLALGLNLEGEKELLGLWISPTEGAKFWLGILTELKNRGVQDVFIACVDGLTGFPEAIETIYPQADVQPCIIHMVRNSLKYVSWKQRKAVADDLKKIYQAVDGLDPTGSACCNAWMTMPKSKSTVPAAGYTRIYSPSGWTGTFIILKRRLRRWIVGRCRKRVGTRMGAIGSRFRPDLYWIMSPRYGMTSITRSGSQA